MLARVVRITVMLALAGFLRDWPGCERARADDDFLWQVPRAGSFGLSPFGGFSFGAEMNGPVLGIEGLFFAEHFLIGLDGRGVFIDEGVMYSFGLELDGRLGPFFGGLGTSLDWLPGRTAARTPALTFQAGLHVVTPWPEVWLNTAYHTNIAFLESRQLVYHSVMVGLLFLTGS